MEYINVARNFNAGLGFVQNVKPNFISNQPIVHSALNGRPIGLTLIIIEALRINNDLYFLQVLSFTVSIINAVLIYVLAKRYVSLPIAFVGGLLAIVNPNILVNSRLILSEPIFATFILLALISLKHKFLTGILLGLAYLVRLEGLGLLVIILVLYKNRLSLLFGFLTATLPYFMANSFINGNPFYTYNTVHYQMRSFLDWINGGYGKTLPPVWTFVRGNISWIISKIFENVVLHIKSLVEFGYFGPLFALLLLSLKKYLVKNLTVFLFATFTIILYGSMWSAIFERARHFIPIYLLLLLPILQFINAHKKNVIVWFLVAVTFCGYFAYDTHRIVWAREVDPEIDFWSQSERLPMYAWIKGNIGKDKVTSTSDSLYFNLWTGNSAITTPNNLTDLNFKQYVYDYKIDYFLVLNSGQEDLFARNALLVKRFERGAVYKTRP